jgi:hypothetical protein
MIYIYCRCCFIKMCGRFGSVCCKECSHGNKVHGERNNRIDTSRNKKHFDVFCTVANILRVGTANPARKCRIVTTPFIQIFSE